jgi:hypothetical protein
MYARVYRGGARESVRDCAEVQDGTSCHRGRRYDVDEKTVLGGYNGQQSDRGPVRKSP